MILCGAIAGAFAAAAFAKSPLLDDDAVNRAAVAIHDQILKI